MCNRDTEMKCYWYIRIAKARKLNTAQPKIPAPLGPCEPVHICRHRWARLIDYQRFLSRLTGLCDPGPHSQAHFPSNVALLVAQIENHASSSRYEPTSTHGGRRS